jgi:hypothetical protein
VAVEKDKAAYDRCRPMKATRKIQPAKSVEQLQPAANLLPLNTRGCLNLKDTARYLSCAEITVRRLCARGVLRPLRMTSRLLFSVKALNRLIDEESS